MDWSKLKQWLQINVPKYKYVILVLLAGLILVLLPENKDGQDTSDNIQQQETHTQECMDQRLAEILSQIKGAGKVHVLLTTQRGEQIVYQTDQKSYSSDGGNTQWDTVIITGADRVQTGLVTQINPPLYQGAIIVCEGADKATVRLSIVEAVSRVTGLGADQISVLKMK